MCTENIMEPYEIAEVLAKEIRYRCRVFRRCFFLTCISISASFSYSVYIWFTTNSHVVTIKNDTFAFNSGKEVSHAMLLIPPFCILNITNHLHTEISHSFLSF